jgi:hypothetical protein
MGDPVTAAPVSYNEAATQRRPESTPLSHLSVELGHFYPEDASGGPDRLQRHFRRIAPWANAARATCADRVPSGRPRISTCFMVDDYFGNFPPPAELVPQLIEAAAANGLVIDYLARESGCAQAGDIPLARLVESRLVPVPVPGTTGLRPPTAETGWLCNGERTPHSETTQAMKVDRQWRRPYQHGAGIHSIFVDVELWDEVNGERRWSCPFLAAVWQLNRLGLIRHLDRVVAAPQLLSVSDLPGSWEQMPAVGQLNPAAAPFSAYRTFSVLGARYLTAEHAVRTILNQISIDDLVAEDIMTRSRAERIELPKDLVERIDYTFLTD